MGKEKTLLEKQKLREATHTDIFNKVLVPNKLETTYTVTLRENEPDLVLPARVQLSTPARFDNMLRNFAYARKQFSTHRLEDMLLEYDLIKELQDIPQRPVKADLYSVRWAYANKKISRAEGLRLIAELKRWRSE